MRGISALTVTVAVLVSGGQPVVLTAHAGQLHPSPTTGFRALASACKGAPARTERVNVSSSGEEANNFSFGGRISTSGRFVAFSSYATNLVPGDNNSAEDVFVRDRVTRQTIRVSVSSSGLEADGASYLPLLSGDGRLVAFRSVATNLASPAGRIESLYLHDRATGETARVPLGPTGENPPSPPTSSRRAGCERWCVNAMSADGRALVITSRATDLVRGDRNRRRDVFVRLGNRTIRVSHGPKGESNGPSEGASISEHGRVVAFRSFSSNLVRDDTNGLPDVFVRDMTTGVTERVNVSARGAEADKVSFRGMVSGNGRFVGFRSRADNLVSGDTNHALDAFVHDRVTGKTTRVDVASDGTQASSLGHSQHVRDNLFVSRPFLSANGRYTAFTSRASNLVPRDRNGHADVFVHDLRTGRTVRASVPDGGGWSLADSRVAGISADGRVVSFTSVAPNLVPGDTNHRQDYFVRVNPARACRVPRR